MNTTTITKLHDEVSKLATPAEIIEFCQGKRAWLKDGAFNVKLAVLDELDRLEAEAEAELNK